MANTGRMNLAEELGRIDSEKMNSNRRAEKDRVIGELNKGYKNGGKVKGCGIAIKGKGKAYGKNS
tara:strand:- start:295 stop:489 length:195 start_codon:yes stop_codon:yes gene_type:complete